MNVGRVEKGDKVLLYVFIGDPALNIVDAASDDVAVVLDLKADGLHGRLVQVFFQGTKKLKSFSHLKSSL